MSEQTDLPQWAVIELMGHTRYGGKVSKDNQLGTAMLRVDVPTKDDKFISQLINPQSIYRITFCDEAIARAAADNGDPKPFQSWELAQLLPPSRRDVTDPEESDDFPL